MALHKHEVETKPTFPCFDQSFTKVCQAQTRSYGNFIHLPRNRWCNTFGYPNEQPRKAPWYPFSYDPLTDFDPPESRISF